MTPIQSYEKIPSTDSGRPFYLSSESEDDLFPENEAFSRPRRISVWKRICFLGWQIAAILSLTTTLFLGYQNWRLQRLGSYSSGWKTDLLPVTEALEIVQTSFTGGLFLDAQLNLIRAKEPGLTQYVGTPSPALDKAWDELMLASEVKLEGEEAKPWEGLTIEEENGSVRIEIEVYHTLHCVDEVRKAIDFDYYYADKDMPYWWRDHVDHCLDYIRQTVMCHADITPLTFLPEPRLNNTNLPVFGATRTCRSFEKIHQWALARHDPFRHSDTHAHSHHDE